MVRKATTLFLMLFFLVSLNLSSCSEINRLITLSPTNGKIPAEIRETRTLEKPTLQVTISFTPSASPLVFTPQPSPTLPRTIVPSLTPSLSTFTSTPVPTLSDAQKDEHFQNAMRGSENCRWPCFGGVTPGKTTWEDAIRILGTLVTWEKSNSDQSKNWSYKLHGTVNWCEGYISRDDQDNLRELWISGDLKTDVLKVSNVLKTYGKPSQIYIYPNAIGFGDIGVFQLMLEYREKNAVLYYEWDEKQVGNFIIAYDPPGSDTSPRSLALIGEENFIWTPEADANAVMTYITKPKFSPLYSISNMTVEQFTQVFIDPNTHQTIKIPLSAIQ